MEITKVVSEKKKYQDLLLLADEQENMIDKYLDRGEMFVLTDNGVKGECVVTKEAKGVYGLRNLDDAIEKYTKAMNLAKECSDKLNTAVEKVNKVLKENGTLEEFNVEN